MPQSRAEVGRGAVCRKRWEFSPVCSEQELSKVSGQPQNLIFFGPRYDFRVFFNLIFQGNQNRMKKFI